MSAEQTGSTVTDFDTAAHQEAERRMTLGRRDDGALLTSHERDAFAAGARWGVEQALDFRPGRWWRVIAPDDSLWCETSNEREARSRVREGDRLERLYRAEVEEWRTEQTGADRD